MKKVDKLLKLADKFEKKMLLEKFGQTSVIKNEQQKDSDRFKAISILESYFKKLIEDTMDKAVNSPDAPQGSINVTVNAVLKYTESTPPTVSATIQANDPEVDSWAKKLLMPVVNQFDTKCKELIKQMNVFPPIDSDFKVNRVY